MSDTANELDHTFTGGTWSSPATSECPTYSNSNIDEGTIDYQYGIDTTRWMTFVKAKADDCSMSLLQNIEPQYVFSVV